jgi:hypothetical protein
MAVTIRPNFKDFFTEEKLPELEAVILAKNESYQSMIPVIFNTESMDSDIYQTTTYSGLKNPILVQENEKIGFQALKPGFSKTYTAKKYAAGFKISKEMVRDEKFSFIQRATESFSKGMFEIKEFSAAGVFDDGFTVNGYDGVPLFSTQHPLENGDGAFGVNRPAAGSELSITSYRELRNIAQDTVNENGQLVKYNPSVFIVPQAQQDDAAEIVKSMYNPENANNAINTVYEHTQLLPGGFWNYLEDNEAFFLASNKNEHYLMFLERQALEISSDYDHHAQGHELIADCRFDQGYSSWRGVVGNPGI